MVTAGAAPKSGPARRQQAAETSIAVQVTRMRPSRSAMSPAPTEPIAPMPITANVASEARLGVAGAACRAAVKLAPR